MLGLLLGGAVWLLGAWAQRTRKTLAATGLLPRVLGVLRRATGLGAFALVLWGAIALAPTPQREVRWGLIVGLAVVVLIAARGVLPDVFAALVLLVGRRVRPGMRLEGPGFSGALVRIGWQSTQLRSSGGILDVPNRAVLASPVRVSRAFEHELVLQLVDPRATAEVRRAIEDAVLASAWTPPRPNVRVFRDPRDPCRWVVRTRLIDSKYAPDFDADLPERIDAERGGATQPTALTRIGDLDPPHGSSSRAHS